MNAFLETLAANSIIAAGLGLLALGALRRLRDAPLAHALALLALIKLLTPALFSIEVAIPGVATTSPLRITTPPPARAVLVGVTAIDSEPRPTTLAPKRAAGFDIGTTLLGIWLLGAATTLFLTIRRARRFSRLIDLATPAADELQTLLEHTAAKLGLRRTPRLVVIDGQISPCVFALCRRPTILLSTSVATGLTADELRAVLAHELAHLANRDHWTRWLECGIAALYWWNPLAHALRHVLNEAEEQRCDARAIHALAAPAHYGRSILKTTSFLTDDATPLPLGASGLGGPRSLKRRLIMIAERRLSHRLSRASRFALAASAACLLPLGLSAQQDEHETQEHEAHEHAHAHQGKNAHSKLVDRLAEEVLERIQAKLAHSKRAGGKHHKHAKAKKHASAFLELRGGGSGLARHSWEWIGSKHAKGACKKSGNPFGPGSKQSIRFFGPDGAPKRFKLLRKSSKQPFELHVESDEGGDYVVHRGGERPFWIGTSRGKSKSKSKRKSKSKGKRKKMLSLGLGGPAGTFKFPGTSIPNRTEIIRLDGKRHVIRLDGIKGNFYTGATIVPTPRADDDNDESTEDAEEDIQALRRKIRSLQHKLEQLRKSVKRYGV